MEAHNSVSPEPTAPFAPTGPAAAVDELPIEEREQYEAEQEQLTPAERLRLADVHPELILYLEGLTLRVVELEKRLQHLGVAIHRITGADPWLQ